MYGYTEIQLENMAANDGEKTSITIKYHCCQTVFFLAFSKRLVFLWFF